MRQHPGQRRPGAAGEAAERRIADGPAKLVGQQRRAGEPPQRPAAERAAIRHLRHDEGAAHAGAMRRAAGEPGQQHGAEQRRKALIAEAGERVQAILNHAAACRVHRAASLI